MNGSRQPDPFLIRCGRLELDCRPGAPTLIMGILNVTPDSFADGGRYLRAEDALQRVDEMVGEGVDILDVGGESTRPRGKTYGRGATPVSLEEEKARVIPVIEAVTSTYPDLVISIDTYKAEVARAALAAGAHIVNDVTGLRFDPQMGRIAAEATAPIVLMHSVGDPGTMPHDTAYEDVVESVIQSLRDAVAKAEADGVAQIIVDPGFGFGKRVADNLRLIARLDELATLGRPVLVGVSRKSSIGSVLSDDHEPVPVDARLFGSLGATAVAIMKGASIIRCHDVSATKDVGRMVDALAAHADRPIAEASA
jgi:dihydropteroate synthase